MIHMNNSNLQTIIRFLTKIRHTGNCWEWNGAKNEYGYGFFSLPNNLNGKHGKLIRAHRFAYELFKGEIPKGLQLDHLCRNRLCVNPDHLETVTSKQNTLRGNNPAALNARKTHCPKGHELKGDNLKAYELRTHGYRACRICGNVLAKKLNRERMMSVIGYY